MSAFTSRDFGSAPAVKDCFPPFMQERQRWQQFYAHAANWGFVPQNHVRSPICCITTIDKLVEARKGREAVIRYGYECLSQFPQSGHCCH
jgi:hypothetical protein